MRNDIYQALYTRKFKNETLSKFYLDRYVKIIDSLIKLRKEKPLEESKKTNLHHIVPRSWCKDESLEYLIKDKENLIELTIREHFIVHLILYHTGDFQMKEAIWRMSNSNKNDKNIVKSNTYALLVESYSKDSCGSGNANYGHHWTDEQKQKLSSKKKKYYETHSIWNKGISPKKESIEKFKKTVRENKSFSGKNNPNYGKKVSKEMVERIANKVHLYYENLSDEEREKIRKNKSAASKKMWSSEEYKKNHQIAMNNAKEKIGLKSKENWKNPIYREKIISKLIGKPAYNSKKVQCIETGEIFDSVAKCVKIQNIGRKMLDNHLKKKRKR